MGRLHTHARAVARGLLWATEQVRQRWRWPLVLALLGALLTIGVGQRRAGGWESRAQLVMRPTFLLEGYLLSTNDLGRYYAQRFKAPARVVRAMRATAIATPPLSVTAAAEPGTGLVTLRVRHEDTASAEALAAAMQADFLQELRRENASRPEQDRLWLDTAPATFAAPLRADWPRHGLLGAVAGGLLGSLIALLLAIRASRRILVPLHAEQLTGAPTLAAIPWRGP